MGLSTGLDYPPGAYASTDELVELSEETSRMGGFYHTHTRASLRPQGLLAPWEEALDIGAALRNPHPPHPLPSERARSWQPPGLPRSGGGRPRRGHGRDFRLLHIPILRHHHHNRSAFWAKDGGPERLMAALRDPEDRARMAREISADRLKR